jgi:hypothetical protein
MQSESYILSVSFQGLAVYSIGGDELLETHMGTKLRCLLLVNRAPSARKVNASPPQPFLPPRGFMDHLNTSLDPSR